MPEIEFDICMQGQKSVHVKTLSQLPKATFVGVLMPGARESLVVNVDYKYDGQTYDIHWIASQPVPTFLVIRAELPDAESLFAKVSAPLFVVFGAFVSGVFGYCGTARGEHTKEIERQFETERSLITAVSASDCDTLDTPAECLKKELQLLNDSAEELSSRRVDQVDAIMEAERMSDSVSALAKIGACSAGANPVDCFVATRGIIVKWINDTCTSDEQCAKRTLEKYSPASPDSSQSTSSLQVNASSLDSNPPGSH